MARYNSVNPTGSIAGGSTLSTPASGLLTTITGSGTVTLPSPVLYAGSTQTFYNSTGSAITLSSSPTFIVGPGITGSSTTISLASGAIITLVSDGANYVAQAWLGGSVVTTSLTATGGSINNTTIGATTAATGTFTTLTATNTTSLAGGSASGVFSFTSAQASSATNNGGIVVTGGAGIGGSLYVGGSGYVVNATNPTTWVSVDTALTTQSMYMQVNTTNSDTRIGSYTNHALGIYTNNTVRMTVDTSGKVGIGIVPVSALSIKNAVGGDGMIRLIPTVTNTETSIGFYNDVNGTTSATRWVIGANSWGAGGKFLIGYNTGPFVSIDTNGLVGIGTPNPGVSLDLGSKTDAIALPKGSTAQRPTPAAGHFRYNSGIGNGVIEFYNASSSWLTLSVAADGSSAAQAGFSAQTIKNLTGTTTSGYYYILLGGTPTQVWCDMSGSTAWMLLMRLSSGGNVFYYDSAYWQNGTTGLNATGDPLTNIDIKNGQLWSSATINTMRLTGSTSATAYTANPLTFGTFNATANTIFNAGSNTWDAQVGYSRAEWLAWARDTCGNAVSNFDTQPNCNTTTVNNTGTGSYARVRIGWAGNNENDCGTNDSFVGPGGFFNGNQLNGGAQSWTPQVYTPVHMWLWTNTV